MATNLSRERIEEIREWAQAPDKYLRKRPGFRLPDPGELDKLTALALRATEPGMVMVPREPTEKMIECAVYNMDPTDPHDYIVHHAYMDMIRAAQEDQP